jgi:hypothetical protein
LLLLNYLYRGSQNQVKGGLLYPNPLKPESSTIATRERFFLLGRKNLALEHALVPVSSFAYFRREISIVYETSTSENRGFSPVGNRL